MSASETETPVRYVNSDALTLIFAACVRQAIVDYRRGYVGYKIPDAAAFLKSAGILMDDGSIDAHGHKLPAPKPARRPACGHRAAGEEPS